MFPYFETRTFRWKIVRGAPNFSAQTVFDTKNLVKHRRFPLQKSFVTMRHNNSEVLLQSPLSYPKNVSILECLWNTEGYSTKGFATVRQKNGRQIVIFTSPYIHKMFANQIVSEPQKRSSTKSFGTVRQNMFDVQFTPFYPEFHVIPYCFWNTGGFPHNVFRYCETTNFRRKVLILSRVLSIKFSDARRFLKHWKVPRQKTFVGVRHNNFDGNSW